MELSEEDFGLVCTRSEPCEKLVQRLKEYDDAKLRAAEEREQRLLEKTTTIERLLNKLRNVKCK